MNQQFLPFELELYQSLYEHQVEYNLADSSVKCLGTRDWLTPEETEELLSTGLFYPEVNGTQALREAIAALYPGATPQNILVTVGASQANSMVCQTLLSPGDEVIVMGNAPENPSKITRPLARVGHTGGKLWGSSGRNGPPTPRSRSSSRFWGVSSAWRKPRGSTVSTKA